MDIPKNDKTNVIVLKDFLHYPDDVPPRLADHDACIWALGTCPAGMSEEEYTKVTYDYSMAAVIALEKGGVGRVPQPANEGSDTEKKPFRFVFISGEGADQTEKSWILFSRVMVSDIPSRIPQ